MRTMRLAIVAVVASSLCIACGASDTDKASGTSDSDQVSEESTTFLGMWYEPGELVAMEIVSVDPVCVVRMYNSEDVTDFNEYFTEVTDIDELVRTTTDDGSLRMYALRCGGAIIILFLPTDNYDYIQWVMCEEESPMHRLFRQ